MWFELRIRRMKYKVSNEMKFTFILSILLFITGLFTGNDAVTGTSIVIFVILSVAIEILEAIFDFKKEQ